MLPDRFSTDHFEFISYTLLEESNSLKILEERNKPEIRQYMADPHIIEAEEHLSFVNSLKKRQDRKYYAVRKRDGEIIASQSLNPIDWTQLEGESGQFIFQAYQGKGFGKLMKQEFFAYLLENNYLSNITERVLIENARNYQLDLKLGFEIYDKDCRFYYLRLNKSNLKTEK